MKILKFILIILFLASVVYFSGKFNKSMYNFYLTAYYKQYRSDDLPLFIKEAGDYLKNKDFSNFEKYTKRLLIVYPYNKRLLKITGQYYYDKREYSKAIPMIINSLDYDVSEYFMIKKIIPGLLEKGFYGDVVDILSSYSPDGDGLLAYYYAIALFKTGKYDSAFKYFNISLKKGHLEPLNYYYLSLIYEIKGKNKIALEYMKKAELLSKKNYLITRELIRLYKKNRQYKKADDVSRNLTK